VYWHGEKRKGEEAEATSLPIKGDDPKEISNATKQYFSLATKRETAYLNPIYLNSFGILPAGSG